MPDRLPLHKAYPYNGKPPRVESGMPDMWVVREVLPERQYWNPDTGRIDPLAGLVHSEVRSHRVTPTRIRGVTHPGRVILEQYVAWHEETQTLVVSPIYEDRLAGGEMYAKGEVFSA